MVTTLNELVIRAEFEQLRRLEPWITAFVDQIPVDIPTRHIFSAAVVLAAHEVTANQIDHAYKHADGQISLNIEYDPAQAAVVTHIQDWGAPLDVKRLTHTTWQDTVDGQQLISVEQPTWDQERGRGLFLIHSLTDRTVYQSRSGSNLWQLTRFIKSTRA